MDFSKFYNLPTREFYDHLLGAVGSNQVTILTAETGAGKSTQVPQYLAENGWDRVIVTQPRILAARNLAYRVREEWDARNGSGGKENVGYRTAHERDDSGNARILYCTDGLQLVRELTGMGASEKQILVLDEVHEWNENMEVLVAWANKRAHEDPNFRVLVMSATLDHETLADYYGTEAVLEIPGRHYPVEKDFAGVDLLDKLTQVLENPGANVLTFLPGKAEIQDVTDALDSLAARMHVPVLPLHSQLTADEQQKVFASYPHGKIILSTNIAQTSITIDDIDMVVDSGLERRMEVRSGVEGLFLAQISRADIMQRAGRAGRTKPGRYVLARYGKLPVQRFDEREKYPTPEILRKHIDRLTLRLANIGMDIEDLDFYHTPGARAVRRAKKTLYELGAITHDMHVTGVGKAMEQFPLSSRYARMLVEARKINLASDTLAKLALVIAIAEVGGIIRGGSRYVGWRMHARNQRSDLLAEFEVFLDTLDMSDEELDELGVITRNVAKAREVYGRLARELGLTGEYPVREIGANEEGAMLRCIIAGQIDQIWLRDIRGKMRMAEGSDERELSSTTVVSRPNLVVGEPFDLQVPNPKGGLEVISLVQNVTSVPAKILTELAPDKFVEHGHNYYYDQKLQGLARATQLRMGRHVIIGDGGPVTKTSPQNVKLFRRELASWLLERLQKQRRGIAYRYKNVPQITTKDVARALRDMPPVVNLQQMTSEERKYVVSLMKLHSFWGEDFHRRLQPSHKRHKYSKKKYSRKGRR